MKIHQVIPSGDILSKPVWYGQICWPVVWKWVLPMLLWFYREILCIARDDRMAYIIMGPVGHPALRFNYDQARFCTPLYRIILSWELLAWISVEGRFPCSFTNFITIPELSGPLYISPDIYHTQITEYLLWERGSLSLWIEHLPHCSSVRHSYGFLDRNWSLREHVSHALPTEMIFHQLRLIHSDHDYSAELMLDSLEIIIKWQYWWIQQTNLKLKVWFATRDLGFRATEWLVRSFPAWTSSIQSSLESLKNFTWSVGFVGIASYATNVLNTRNIFILWMSMRSNLTTSTTSTILLLDDSIRIECIVLRDTQTTKFNKIVS